MGFYSTILEKWWVISCAGFILALFLFTSHSRSGYNISVIQNLTLPTTASTSTVQYPIPMPADNIKQLANSSDQFTMLELMQHSCMPSNFPCSEKPKTSSSSSSSHQDPLPPSKPSKVHNDNKPSRPSKVYSNDDKPNKMGRRCNIFEGKWVYDPKESPLYDAGMCPFLSDRVSCQRNGRPDKEYERWRWEANDCKIPRFEAKDMLERLRGKRVVIVGDSINFGQWESLVCILYSALPAGKSHLDARNRVFTVKSYNLIVESSWAEFLVEARVNQTSGKKILNLDLLSSAAWKWKGADIMVFNTGHWWMGQRWDLLMYKKKLYTDMKLERAFKLAMQTWAGWIDKNVDTSKTTVFFRGLSPGHSRCHRATRPEPSKPLKLKSSESLIQGVVERTIQRMRTPVEYLNITKLTAYRNDAHSSVYWKKKQFRVGPDCSHWCLPGVPDTWNHLLYATMVLDSSKGVSNS